MVEALFYQKVADCRVKCLLCPRNCTIDPDKFGDCRARRNRDGELIAETYGKLSSLNLDPVEKKPLYHFFPGSSILSAGSVGCNLHCQFCQNHTLSQCNPYRPPVVKMVSPEELVALALATDHNIGLAFTYNEPVVSFEFVTETARLARSKGLKTVMITNGYINSEPLAKFTDCIDAFNIDLKAFSGLFYTKQCKATLEPVKNSLKQVSLSGKHLEITNLVIPGYNDDCDEFEAMCHWIADQLGRDTVLHLSRYFPRFGMEQYPTPTETLFELYDLAKTILDHVYIGNLATELHSNTYCPQCGKTLIKRTYYHLKTKGLSRDGKCTACGYQVFSHL